MNEGFIARFARVAERLPDALAVTTGEDGGLRYGELYRRVQRLGSALIARGVGPEQVVAIALPRSADYVASVLACWYAGAAFVPLDPALPPARRAAYLKQSGARVGIADAASAEQQPRDVVWIEPGAPPGMLETAVPFDPARLAYVIFTSGSSGMPKGVAVEHRGLVPMLDAQIALFGLEPGDRSLWLLSTAFDASISDLGTALLSGASLQIAAPHHLGSARALGDTLQRRAISYVDLPPALLPHLDDAALPALRTIVIGGEAGNAAAIRRWAARVRLVNVYGPTEATVCTSASVCGADWDRALLGRELPGVRYRVRDGAGVPCPPDVAGELYISGPCLARGYLGAPELTAERFVTHDGVRAFRSGDRVVRRADGALEFLGRCDRQLKVRGALVAPEEVEAQLCAHPAVRRAALVEHGRARVPTAFFEGERVGAQVLRQHLAARLPRPMVPDRFVWLAALPSGVNGKLDLARLQRSALPHEPRGAAPSTAGERRVAAWFERVLGVSAGTDDDFHALGGSSLHMIELIALAAQDGVELTPALLADAPTVASLARSLERPAARGMAASELRSRARAELLAARPLPVAMPSTTASDEDAVLVTGATGFLGSRVVCELLAATRSRVLCLVRADSPATARQRVHDALRAHGRALEPHESERIVAIPADLEHAQLGLALADFHALAARVHSLFHCGAQVSLMADLAALWPANVAGTAAVLQLVASGRPKALSYASTLSVFVSADQGEGAFFEADALAGTRTVFGGYGQSKWAAEVLVREHAQRIEPRAPLYIHRLGLLTADSQTGRGAQHDWLALTVRGLAALGEIPRERDHELALDVTPVDYAARAMVAIAARTPARSGLHTLHLAAPRPTSLDELIAALRAAGVGIREVANQAWRARVRDALASTPAPELATVCLALQRAWLGGSPAARVPEPPRHPRELDLFQATRCRFDTSHARELLRGSAIACPEPSPQLLLQTVRAILHERRP